LSIYRSKRSQALARQLCEKAKMEIPEGTKASQRRIFPLLAVALFAAATQSCPGQGVSVAENAAPAELPRFEAASVRPSGPSGRELNGFYTYPGGRIVARGCRLQYLIMLAFNLDDFQIENVPGWASFVAGEGFDIQAVPPDKSESAASHPASAKDPPNAEQRQMLLALLIDRFQLKVHSEKRVGQIYLLARGKGGLKLEPPGDKNAYPSVHGISGGWFRDGIRGEDISMPQLAERLSWRLERPVIDQTGLVGSFDFEYRNNDANNDADITGFLLTAMKAIGLELKSSEGPIETIVIDHVEPPSPN
jgi:uncharacterized protein (TIGR03435 family)